jgi:single-stranded-DNA-specific exonuclease
LISIARESKESAVASVTKVWHLLPFDRERVEQLARTAGVSSIVAQLLLNRGIDSAHGAKRFLDTTMVDLHVPALLPGINEAVERLWTTIENKKKICIYGDYDVDGVTGTSILFQLFRLLGVPVEFYTPNRLEEGYGVNIEAIRTLHGRGVHTVITVDCGITSVAEAEEARRLGMEMIITDHHEMKAVLPNATVLVHPRLPGSQYPFAGLSGAGVAFKLAWALAMKASGSEKVTTQLRNFLMDAVTLATLGLVADVVPLHDENRILTKHGLQRLRKAPPMGMKALIESAGLKASEEFKAEDIGFRLAPRMNAAGRLGYAGMVVEMLTTTDPKRAQEIAQYLETQNSDRQAIERKMFTQAKDQLEGIDLAKLPAVVLSHPEWHPGVIGIVAGRMVELLGRPTLIIAARPEEQYASGSGRSIPGFPLHEALRACESELITHGGHAMAAGFKVAVDRIDSLREKFRRFVVDHFPERIPPKPRLVLDAELPLQSINHKLVEEMNRLEPYGAENPKPKFLIGPLQLQGDPRRIGDGEMHLSFRVKQGSTSMRAVAWRKGERMEELLAPKCTFFVVATPVINEWQGSRNVELHVADFQVGEEVRLG